MTQQAIKDEALLFCRQKLACHNDDVIKILCGFANHLLSGTEERQESDLVKENKRLHRKVRQLKAEKKELEDMLENPVALADYIAGI